MYLHKQYINKQHSIILYIFKHGHIIVKEQLRGVSYLHFKIKKLFSNICIYIQWEQ